MQRNVAMKIHWHPPLPLPHPPPLRRPLTPLETEFQAAEMTEAAQAQRSRLKKLYGTRKRGDLDEETHADEDDLGSPPKQNIDVIA